MGGDRLWTCKPPRRRTRHLCLLSISLCPLWLGWNEYPAKDGGVNRHIPASIRSLAVFAECLAGELACGDQRRRTGSCSALETLRDDALYTYRLLYFTSVPQILCWNTF